MMRWNVMHETGEWRIKYAVRGGTEEVRQIAYVQKSKHTGGVVDFVEIYIPGAQRDKPRSHRKGPRGAQKGLSHERTAMTKWTAQRPAQSTRGGVCNVGARAT